MASKKTTNKLQCTGEIDRSFPGKYVFGIDEAGRGPIAGPMFVGIVGFMPFCLADCKDQIESIGLKDSKQLSEKKRFIIHDMIYQQATHTTEVVKIPALYIDNAVNINDLFDQTVSERLVGLIGEHFGYYRTHCYNFLKKRCIILVDGNRKIKGLPPEIQVAKPKLDATSWSVAAASILAKNAQVRYMYELDKKNPEYHFAKHKGYGTKLHFEAIKSFGFHEEHRKSWINKEKLQ